MITPKIGLSGQLVTRDPHAAKPVAAAVIEVVHGDGTVDARRISASADSTNLSFVDVGGPAPGTGDYFQAIDAAS